MQFKTFILFFIFSTSSFAGISEEFFSKQFISAKLKQLQKNPHQFMLETPTKAKTKLNYLVRENFVSNKLRWRQYILSSGNKSEPKNNDRAEDLLGTSKLEKNIVKMHEQQLNIAQVEKLPWSDDYWPIYKGMLGARYAVDDFISLDGWSDSYSYILANPADKIFASQDQDSINNLSPAEKYDLLIGAKDQIFTKYGWDQGKAYMNSHGEVETWMGICHGWAPASYMLDRPQNAIEVMSFDGVTKIKMFPSDIKALASMLWAQTNTPTRFVGGRCQNRDPRTDDNNRPTDRDCLDTNPATWHLSIVNSVGIKKQSFVLDATYDYEVWNQPVVGYKYRYFDPRKQEIVDDLSQAKVLLSDFSNDRFRKHRSPKAQAVIGIAMELIYGVETAPSHREYDSSTLDGHNRVLYLYDLELDAQNNIVGGEWYQEAHPDFLWTPENDARAMSMGDYYIMHDPYWDGKDPISQDWAEVAQVVAKKGGQPLAMIVESLIKISNQKQNRAE